MTVYRNGKRVEPAVKPAPRQCVRRTYYAQRLLEHGPLELKEFMEITRWQKRACIRALGSLVARGAAAFDGREWRLS